MGASRRTVTLLEAIKNSRQQIGCDSYSTVADHNLGAVFDAVDADINRTVFRSEFQWVRKKIRNNLLKALGIGFHEEGRFNSCGQCHVLSMCCWTRGLDRCVDNRGEIDPSFLDSQFAGDDPGHVEEILNQLRLQ